MHRNTQNALATLVLASGLSTLITKPSPLNPQPSTLTPDSTVLFTPHVKYIFNKNVNMNLNRSTHRWLAWNGLPPSGIIRKDSLRPIR